MERYKKVGLTKEEYDRIVAGLNREPNDLELAMFGVLWSEHCSYKNSRALLKLFNTKGDRVLQGPGENAGAVDIGDGLAVIFKMESHNHPSALEPYQGAATGVGGILRDIFTMGARPIANLNSIRFGKLDDDKNKRLLKGVVKGIGDYGNSVGIPTVAGETVFDECYDDNPLVNAMSVGIIEQNKLKRAVAEGVGNSVILVGHTTGRDGIGGASFASCNLTEESESMRSAVQVGDPFMEKLLLEACLELMDKDYVVAVQDLGAAGLTSSSCEMALRGGCGIKIDVSKVITREEGMVPEEIMISESQERMLFVVKKGYEDNILEVFNKWNLNAAVIGEITDDGNLTVCEGDKVVGCMPVELLGDGAKANLRPYKRPKYMDELKLNMDEIKKPEDLNKALIEVLKSPNIASKEWVYRQYDYMVRTNTIVKPGGDAAIVGVEGTDKALSLTVDCNARYCYVDAYEGAKIAVCEAARNIAATGATPIAITDCLNFANPEDEEVYYTFRQSILGISEATRVLNTPVVSGNVSFYNESNTARIYPTPAIGMVGLLENKHNACTIDFKKENDAVILVGETFDEIGASEYLKVVHGKVLGNVPKCYLEIEKNTIDALTCAINKGMINSAHDIADGGFIVALCECSFKNNIGAKIDVETDLREDVYLFSESQARFIVTCDEDKVEDVILEFKKKGVKAERIGTTVCGDIEVNINNKGVINQKVESLKKIWGGCSSMYAGLDKFKEECGVFGIFSKENKNVGNIVYYGLFALQHRGQESAGIAYSNGESIKVKKQMGLVSDAFKREDLDAMNGNIAIGHVRYSTTGDSNIQNAQPILSKYKLGSIAIAHNGNLVNADIVRELLEEAGCIFQTSIDSEVVLNLIARGFKKGIERACFDAIQAIKGSYAILILTEDRLIGVRDPNGIRPLCIGKIGEDYILSSESCAIDAVGGEFVRDVLPGEIVVIDKEGIRSINAIERTSLRTCAFEYIYFARPDSNIDGINVYKSRVRAGENLFNEKPCEADIVIGVPDSGTHSAVGYAKAASIPYEIGFIKNKYVGRTFIAPTQELREQAVSIKLNPLKVNIEGKRVVLVDDSIVRGTTMKRLVELLRKSGAKEVHVRIASPVVSYPCYFGIDTPRRSQLIGSNSREEEIGREIGADSIGFLSMDGLLDALGSKHFCLGCFNGVYPVSAPYEADKFMFERKE